MEALAQVLSCPVCLQLFTPPVLTLTCSHNFCKKCLEKVLICQNCSYVNGQFNCPICSKIVHLKGKGILGLPRNILVENILEKFKYELENLHAREQNRLSQICEEHGENMTLVCLTDDKPICAICKLFGEHESHNVSKISEVYTERKNRFIEDIDWTFQQSEHAEQIRKEIEKTMNKLACTIEEVTVMIEAVGASLMKGIRWRMVELKAKLGKEYATKLEKLQQVANELQFPRQLYHQMKTLLEQHSNSVHFLQEDKILRSKMEKLTEGYSLYQDVKNYHISIWQYFKDLVEGFQIDDYVSFKSDETFATSNQVVDTFKTDCPAFSFSGETCNESFCQKVLDFFETSNEISFNQDPAQNVSYGDGSNSQVE